MHYPETVVETADAVTTQIIVIMDIVKAHYPPSLTLRLKEVNNKQYRHKNAHVHRDKEDY